MPRRRTPATKRLNPFAVGRLNQGAGARHEAYIRHVALLEGILCVQNGIRSKRIGDRLVALPQSDIDFLLFRDAKRGEVAAVDAKSFAGPRFGRSQLLAHQMATLAKYHEHGLTAGYIVLLRDSDTVHFFPIATILRAGARAGFSAVDGIPLGTRPNFSLRKIWDTASP